MERKRDETYFGRKDGLKVNLMRQYLIDIQPLIDGVGIQVLWLIFIHGTN